MADEVQNYLATLAEPDRSRIAEIYSFARRVVPAAVEGTSYGMPALTYNGKGLIAVMSTRHHIGVYPFGALAELADDAANAGLDVTKGSLHLAEAQVVPDELLEALLTRRVDRIDRA